MLDGPVAVELVLQVAVAVLGAWARVLDHEIDEALFRLEVGVR